MKHTDTLTRRVALAALSGGLMALVPLAAPVASAADNYPAPVVTPPPVVKGTEASVPKPSVPKARVAPAQLASTGMDGRTEALAVVGGALAGAGVITLVLRRRRAHA
jgi:LPXTG-motif cell wall-anchored protein